LKQLLKIVVAGLLVFIAVAIVQEWGYFASAWFGRGVSPDAPAQDENEARGLAVVRESLALMAHYYSSGGDQRFAERMPVSPVLLEEFRQDVEYLSRNNRYQDCSLQKLELLSAVSVGQDALELKTREFWIHRTFWSDGQGESDPPRSDILYPRYRLVRDNAGWRIYGREFDRPGTE
jgi:hypothetical protein